MLAWSGTAFFALGCVALGTSLFAARRHPEKARASLLRGAATAAMASFFGLDEFFPETGFAIPGVLLLVAFLVYDNRLKLLDLFSRIVKLLRRTAFMRWYASVRSSRR